VTTSVPHGFDSSTGSVTITGADVGGRTYNGQYHIATISSLYTFTTTERDPPLTLEDDLAGTQGRVAASFRRLSFNDVCVDKLEHEMGQALEQAMWEIMFNHDCDNNNCTDIDGVGNDIWPGELQPAVLGHVGKALGATLSSIGQNATFSSAVTAFASQVQADSGTTVANKVRAVFAHHGF
jgi:hypothetical protein